jgi:hypothetical protein
MNSRNHSLVVPEVERGTSNTREALNVTMADKTFNSSGSGKDARDELERVSEMKVKAKDLKMVDKRRLIDLFFLNDVVIESIFAVIFKPQSSATSYNVKKV